LRFIKRKQGELLFAAAVNGNIFAFNLRDLFAKNFMDGGEMGDKDDGEQKMDDSLKEKMEREMYKNYLSEGTPWFLTHPITCVADLANINYLATGCYDKNIYLWDLRNSSTTNKTQQKGGDSQK
jgi:WD40 repeat protein